MQNKKKIIKFGAEEAKAEAEKAMKAEKAEAMNPTKEPESEGKSEGEGDDGERIMTDEFGRDMAQVKLEQARRQSQMGRKKSTMVSIYCTSRFQHPQNRRLTFVFRFALPSSPLHSRP